MTVLYNTAIFFYHLAIHIYSRFNSKAKLWVEGRQNIFTKLKSAIERDEKVVWVHCSSMGEFEQGRPVIEAFRNEFPQFKILLTFFSPSGYEVRKNHEGVDHVFYLPIDTRKNAERFINIVNPKIVIFIKYEFWYHYLNTLHKRQIPTFLVSAIFRHNQHFFKWYGTLFRKILKNLTLIFVQDEVSQTVLDSIGLKNHAISGDTRFDRVYEVAMQVEEIPLIQQFKQDGKLFIAGSTWKEDEKLLIELINNEVSGRTSVSSAEPQAGLKFIIAPHEIKEENIQWIMSQIKCKTIRFSEAKDEEIGDAKVLIIDNMGMLSSLYQYGDIAYIGGGLGRGIHNILEAAAFGMPVVFGPNYHKFQEANDLIEKGGAFSIKNYTELKNNIRFLLSDEYVLKMASEISRNYVKCKRGATGIILNHVREFV